MKRIFLIPVLAFISALPALAQEATTWQIDPAHANAQFVVRHLGISNVQGQFTKVTGAILLDEKDIAKSSVTASIDVNSIDTRVVDRDNDLKSPKIFDVAKYPTMTFQSKRITRVSEGKLQMMGDLTMHGVTREVTFDVDGPTDAIKGPGGFPRRGVSATAKIHRSDFGITKYPAAMVGEDVVISLDLEMVRK